MSGRGLNAARTQIAHLKQKVAGMAATHAAAREGIALTKKQHREILACLHPDRSASEGRLTKALQVFSAIKVTLVDEGQ